LCQGDYASHNKSTANFQLLEFLKKQSSWDCFFAFSVKKLRKRFMNVEQLIVRKRDGYELSENELQLIVEGFVRGDVPDYQMAALLMAIYFQGMSSEETFSLTKQMI
jgi:hypothetical protein